jgi:outer membrane protein assembly factor BamB
MRLRSLLIALTLLIAPPSIARADLFSENRDQNWHQWRGPDATGTSSQANPPVEWSETKNVKWKVEVPGKGSSTPIVWNDRVYVMTAVKTDRVKEGASPSAAPRSGGRRRFGGGPPPTNYYEFFVMAFDRESGDEIWRTKVTEEVPHEGGHNTNTYASSSPTTDGERIYAYFGSRGLFCLDMNGKVLWDRDFGAMRTVATFGEGSSPAVHAGTLVVPWDHEGDSFYVALDAKTGDEK